MNDDDDYFKIESVSDDALLFVFGLCAVILLLTLSFFDFFV